MVRADVLPLLKCKIIIFGLFRAHSLGNSSFIQESVAEQYKGRRVLLSAACIRLRSPERKEKKPTEHLSQEHSSNQL